MRIVSVSDDFLERFASGDREFMQKRGRPCLLVVRLKFRGKRRDFAVPFRSNIAQTFRRSSTSRCRLGRQRGLGTGTEFTTSRCSPLRGGFSAGSEQRATLTTRPSRRLLTSTRGRSLSPANGISRYTSVTADLAMQSISTEWLPCSTGTTKTKGVFSCAPTNHLRMMNVDAKTFEVLQGPVLSGAGPSCKLGPLF